MSYSRSRFELFYLSTDV